MAVLDVVPAGRVAAARRRLAGRDERAWASRLDPGVGRTEDPVVEPRRDGAAALVELRREELLQVRFVPDGVEADERVAGVAARVATGERAREALEVGVVVRRTIAPFAAVGP